MKVNRDLSALKSVDIYSLVLFTLYQLKEVDDYSTLSELAFVLDKKNLFNLLDYFGGTTIRIPTKEELQVVINALIVYQSIKIEHLSMPVALGRLKTSSKEEVKEIKEIYGKLCDILDRYYINGIE